MSLVSVQLPDALQTLIDSRLDTIDRMLLGRMTRYDRMAIVKEVESQIYEQLHERDDQDWDREDVLAILANLNPPEAFIPEEFGAEPVAARTTKPFEIPGATRRRKRGRARLSGILGLSALALGLLALPLLFVAAELTGSELMFYIGFPVTCLLIFAIGVAGLVFGIRARRGGAWAIVGIISSAVALLCFLGAGGLVALELLM